MQPLFQPTIANIQKVMVNFVNSAILFVEFPQVQYMELCEMGCVHNKSFFVVRYIMRAKTLQFP